MKHTISALVENRAGVLARIAGLFSGRGFNIDSLAVGETLDPTVSRMTIVVRGDDRILEQVCKQLNKLIDVVKVLDFTGKEFVGRELLLIKVSCTDENRLDVASVVDIFRGRIVDLNPKSATVEITGDEAKIEGFLRMLRPFGIKEVVRTGRIAMARQIEKK
ncbi:MAG: acetolactate synthase small subunit [Candidatus Tritonobacter lacicola]|nr:acetolactate synthase small subunit [Candidatus Tritonobacter lacicola]